MERKHSVMAGRRARLLLFVSLLFTAGLLLPSSPVSAQEPTEWGTITVETEEAPPVEKPAKGNPKLGSSLNQLLGSYRHEGVVRAQDFAAMHLMVLDDARVQVEVMAAEETMSEVKKAVEAMGGEYQSHFQTILQALVPIGALESLVRRSDVWFIREPMRAIPLEPVLEPTLAGNYNSEGVGASNASAWHTAGYDGSGVKVGVIDVGFEDYTTMLGTELPATVTARDYTGTGIGGSNHGTACAEVVHDMAPGAAMYLSKIDTIVDFDQAVTDLISDNVDIISISAGWYLEGPGDGSGPTEDIMKRARDNGILNVSAAGNQADKAWSGVFNDSDSNDVHEWAAGQEVNHFGPGNGNAYNIPAGYPIEVYLRWDDWSDVNQDYDLYLYQWDSVNITWTVVASSTNTQNGAPGQQPVESIRVSAPISTAYGVSVRKTNATRSNVCLYLVATQWSLDERVLERSLVHPADSLDVMAVGAVGVTDPPTYTLEIYSSQGPTFGPGGICTGGFTKPDIVGYDRVSTVSFGTFAGTSAATPHAAGAAALVKEAYPSHNASNLQSFLENNAIDMGTSGKDNQYGSGRLYLPNVLEPVYLPTIHKGTVITP